MRGRNVALRACLLLAVAAGAAGLSSCGGGGGASGPQATIMPPGGTGTRGAMQQSQVDLTGVEVTLSNHKAREVNLTIKPEPAGASWSNANWEFDPADAGGICCYTRYLETIFVKFECSSGYTGEVTITTIVNDNNGNRVEDSKSFNCR